VRRHLPHARTVCVGNGIRVLLPGVAWLRAGSGDTSDFSIKGTLPESLVRFVDCLLDLVDDSIDLIIEGVEFIAQSGKSLHKWLELLDEILLRNEGHVLLLLLLCVLRADSTHDVQEGNRPRSGIEEADQARVQSRRIGGDVDAMQRSAGDLRHVADALRDLASPCQLCPRACGAERLNGELGACGIGERARVANFGAHFGEERLLVGRHGSGTVFFSGCNLGCVFCQNWTISHHRTGTELDAGALAEVFWQLQEAGCHNLNLVTPTHQVHAIVEALAIAVEGGFGLPIVWNSGGYDSVEVLRLLDGIVDIYMPDAKYGGDAAAARLSGVPDYVARSQAAIREMYRQVGNLALGDESVARHGLLVRHLVLPRGLAGTETVMRFLADAISRDTYVNVMDQYYPYCQADQIPELARTITADEFREAIEFARVAGLSRFA